MLIVKYRTDIYILSARPPQDGDLVMTKDYGVWKYQKAPCPMPYWGNPNACKKIDAVNGIEVNEDNKDSLYDLQYQNFDPSI